MKAKHSIVALILLGIPACAPDAQTAHHPAYGPGQLAMSSHGMVVTASTLATGVGAAVLESGGNAIDAAVASAFALSVVEPSMSGLGGRTQILLRTPDGDFLGIDGTTEISRAFDPAHPPSDHPSRGYQTIATPGTVAALALALERYGTRSLSEILAPAIRLAEGGFTLPAEEAERIAGVADQLAEFEGSRRYFLKPDGTPHAGGERFVQADLGRALRAIADSGATVFYRGWIADSIAADMKRHGGLVTRSDLAQYEAKPARVVRGSYRGFDLVGTYLPASGATTIEALQILENFELESRVGGAEWVALTAQALLLSFEDRTREAAETILSKSWASERAAAIEDPASVAALQVANASPFDWEPAHTTHVSVADGQGGFVALTQSIGPTMGSRVAAPGLGFVYASTLGYLAPQPPGARPFSSQSPMIVTRNGQPRWVLGAAGARRIISSIVQVVSRLVDDNPSLADAMAGPRFHPTTNQLIVENRPGASWTAEELTGLRDFGFNVEARSFAAYFARLYAIEVDPERGGFIGVADPRWSGGARGVERQ